MCILKASRVILIWCPLKCQLVNRIKYRRKHFSFPFLLLINFDKCNNMYPWLQYHTEQFHCSKNTPCSISFPPPKTLDNTYFSGIDSGSGIYILVVVISYYSFNLHFLMVNNIKTQYVYWPFTDPFCEVSI